VVVVLDCRMFTWMWYGTSELSFGCGSGLQIGHVSVAIDFSLVTWFGYRAAECLRGCVTGLQNVHVDVVMAR